MLNGFKLILVTSVHWNKYPSPSEAKGALNNDCSVSCFVETFVFCLMLESFVFFRSFLCEQLERLRSSAQRWVYGCEMRVQKYPRHSEMCRQNMKWNVLMKSKSCQGTKWWEPDFAPIFGSACKLGGAAARENLVPLLQSAVRSACLCLCFHQAGLFLHFPTRHMTSPTGNESGVCRRGHHLATDALTAVFVHVAHPSQGSSRDLSRQTSYSILEEKEVAEYPSATKGSGKA